MPKTGRPDVLITGSSGFLGQAIARGLLQRYHVIGLDSGPAKEPIEGLVTVGIDLISDESVGEAMGQIRVSSSSSARWPGCPGAAELDPVDHSDGWGMGSVRAAGILDDQCGRNCGGHTDRHAGCRVRSHDSADTRNQSSRACGRRRAAARVELLALLLHTAHTDRRAGVSRYLGAYQLGHIDGLWEPFFGAGLTPAGNGSEAVVKSWGSKGFPIADAGLGAVAYALDILAGAIGDRRRWRTMPWMVLLFGLSRSASSASVSSSSSRR